MTSKKQINKTQIKDFNLISLGWELALPIFGGAFLGYQIDKHVGSHYTFTLVFLAVGIIAGYYSLYRVIELEVLRTKAAKLDNQKEDTQT